MRASHADREHVIGILKAAFIQGRLTKGELDSRISQAFGSRTYGELATVTADLPAALTSGLTAAPPKPARTQARPPAKKIVMACAWVFPLPAMAVASFLTGSDQLGNVTAALIFLYLIVGITAGAAALNSWFEKRSRGQLPPQPRQGGEVLEAEPDDRPGNDLILCEARRCVRARHMPDHRVIRRTWRSLAACRDQRRPLVLWGLRSAGGS
jgi:hypothetical protein